MKPARKLAITRKLEATIRKAANTDPYALSVAMNLIHALVWSSPQTKAQLLAHFTPRQRALYLEQAAAYARGARQRARKQRQEREARAAQGGTR